jgi:hypothetical protein
MGAEGKRTVYVPSVNSIFNNGLMSIPLSHIGSRIDLCLQAAGWPKIPEHGSDFYVQAQQSVHAAIHLRLPDPAREPRNAESHQRPAFQEVLISSGSAHMLRLGASLRPVSILLTPQLASYQFDLAWAFAIS